MPRPKSSQPSTKRPRTDSGDVLNVAPPQPSNECLCPICLECAGDPERSFALPCCNEQLAEGEAPQLLHKCCFFAYARSVFEDKVVKGVSILLMPEAELQKTLRCPRCRQALLVDRKYSPHQDFMCSKIYWPMDGTIMVEAKCRLGAKGSELSLFFNVYVGGDAKPPVDSITRKVVAYDQFEGKLPSECLPPENSFSSNQRILGFDFK